ncbi:S-adenosyl-L-methionine-dependent methyltransferase [Fennellomyces sp. T-0311]|nr:S-adenosyl-L-methionine-dependent methyltransferase [Fennellomyces sp. T-0311]
MPAPHAIAADGFEKQADAYARTRPTYPTEALDQFRSLLPNLDAPVVDLAAGTGIMTKLLVARGYTNVTAVEPAEAMREKFSALLPNVPILKGTSWDIPVAPQSQDAVIVAQAFHWFADVPSLREIHRVLKPNGYIILIWNMESPRSAWVRGLRNIYERFDAIAPQYRKGVWHDVFETEEAKALFKLPLNHRQIDNDYRCSRSDILTRVTTKSYIAVLADEQRADVLKEMEAVLDDPANGFTVDDQGLALYPHDTDLRWAQKRD